MKQGFTLIELLVVVLIIGILSAIALPQYEKSVNKARGTEALIAAKTVADSANLFFLERSGYLSACTRIDSLYGWDSNTILEDKMNTPSRNSDIQEKSKLMFQMISEKKYREASALADDIAVVTNDANEDVTYARVLIAKGLRNEKNS